MPGAEDGQEGQGGGAADDKTKNPPNQDGKEDQGGADDKDDAAKPLGFKSVEEAEAEVKKLRKENANRRTTNKSLEERLGAQEAMMGKLKQALGIEKEESPEEVAEQLKSQNSALEVELGISRLALEHGISGDQLEYFGFLFHKSLNSLNDGEEFGDEHIEAIVSKVRNAGGQKKKSSSGIDGGKNPPPAEENDGISLEQFSKMNTGEKSTLYSTNPTVYNRLFEEAKNKRLL